MTKDRARIKASLYLQWADKAQAKSEALYHSFQITYKDFDWTQPILKGHHSQRRHEKVYERRNSMFEKMRELDEKAKSFRSKAYNLMEFANRNAGDAEAKRQKERELADTKITVGSNVTDWVFGSGVVEKVNKKTYTIRFKSGWKGTRDKSFIKI
jgi:hypothetical protein